MSRMSTQYSIEKVIAQVGDLPAIPAVVSGVIEMTEDPTVPMARVSEMIQRDPALTVKILRVSNSPYYGMRQYVGTLKLALVILGAREVRNIVVGIAVFDTLRNEHTDVLFEDDFWNHSLTVAGLSKKLASSLELMMQGEDFIAGLLHDIGKMVLCRFLGDRYAAIYRAAVNKGEALFLLENQDLGYNHCDAAAALISKWNLPRVLCDALYCHHAAPDRPVRDAKDPRLAAIVRIADRAVRYDFEGKGDSPYSACSDIEAWSALEAVCGPIPSGKRSEILREFACELKDMPKLIF